MGAKAGRLIAALGLCLRDLSISPGHDSGDDGVLVRADKDQLAVLGDLVLSHGLLLDSHAEPDSRLSSVHVVLEIRVIVHSACHQGGLS